MKKLLSFAAISIALGGLLVSCASTGSAGAKTTFQSSVEHPRTYVVDMAEIAKDGASKFAQNGSLFACQTQPVTDFWKYDWPQVGDTIEIHYKGTVDIDCPGVELCISNHSTWNNLISQDQCDLALIDGLKAGETFEGVATYTIDGTAPKGKSTVYFDLYYDNCLVAKKGYAKTGKAITIQWIDTDAETTNTANDAGTSVEIVKHPDGAVNFDVNIADAMKMIQWSVGDADASGNVQNYKAFINVTDSPAFKDYLPKAGDTVTFHFKGTSDAAINAPIQVALVDQSEAAGWWLEVGADNWNCTWAESIPANEEFEITGSMTLGKSCIAGLTVFCIYNNTEGASGATWIYSRPE